MPSPQLPSSPVASSGPRLFPIRSVKYPAASGSPLTSPQTPGTGTSALSDPFLRARRPSLIQQFADSSLDDLEDDGDEQAEDLSGTGTSLHDGSQTDTAFPMTTRFTHAVTSEGDMVITGRTGQLQRCEDEPIHAPGAVQSFGVLVAFDEQPDGSLLVQQVSENSYDILGLRPHHLFRLKSFTEILSPDEDDVLREALVALDARDNQEDNIDHAPMLFDLYGDAAKIGVEWMVHAALHRPDRLRYPNRAVVEMELVDDYKNPLRHDAPLPSPSLSDSDRGTKYGMLPDLSGEPAHPPSEQDLRASTTSLVKPLRSLLRHKSRANRGRKEPLDVVGLLAEINDQLDKAEAIEPFLQLVAGVFKELCEFDRVMVYQFDELWNGRVVAEQVDWEKTSDLFRGLSFPATDIPAQARELYKINKVRLLYDRDQPTARLCCRSLEQVETPLDMTQSYLRAMSPIHLKYLENMGVRSSFSVSITAFGDLWGLVAMHTYGEAGTRVAFPTRQLCKLLGDSISRNIERLSYHRRLYARKLINTAPTDANPSGYIVAKAEDLLTLFDCDFGVLSIAEEAKILGPVFNSQELLAVLEYLRQRRFQSIVMTPDLTKDFPDIDFPPGFKLIAGFLVVPLSSEGRDFIVFFRKGQLQEVHWAGNPYAQKMSGDNYRPLEPRKSFKTWSELVVGKSKAWTDEEAETAGVLCLIYGKFISVWRQKETALAANQLTNLLLANASHELRTPLHSIINYLELALEGPVEGEVRENLTRSHEASRSLIYVINDLLDLTRAERGNDLSISEPFDLPETIAMAAEIHKTEAKRKGVSLDIIENPSGTPPILLGDRTKIRQVIANLINNAVKHTDSGSVLVEWGELADGNVEDAAEKRQDSIRIGISVVDTGCGITEENLEMIFREFEQVTTVDGDDNDSSASSPVVGLGLAVVARIVRTLNGQLRVDSEPGKGSKFQLILPFYLPPEGDSLGARSSDRRAVEDGSGTGSSRTMSAVGTRDGGDSSTLVRSNSNGSGSASSLHSLGSKASEIDALITDLASSPMDVASTAGSGGSRRSRDSRRSIMSASSARRARTATPHDGEVPVSDSKTPIRSVKVAPSMSSTASDTARRLSLSSPPTSPAAPSRPQLQRADSSPAAPSPDQMMSPLNSPSVSQSQTGPKGTVPSPSPPHMSDFKSSKSTEAISMPALRVLVVEDELVNRTILQKRLTKEGHEVVTAVHGGDALRLLQKDSAFDIVLMDLQMPILNGYDASVGIRGLERQAKTSLGAQRPSTLLNGRIPILAVSASLSESEKPRLQASGLDGWLLKPVDSRRLFRLMEGLLDVQKRNEDLYVPGKWEKGGWLEADLQARHIEAAKDSPSMQLAT